MITSIRVNGMYNIKSNSNNKIKIEDNLLHVEKDIPFVRYRFTEYGDSAVEYIKRMQAKFVKSTHLVEMKLDDLTATYYENIRNNMQAAIYLYIEVTEEMIKEAALTEECINRLKSVQNCNFDRYMLKDTTTDSLDYTTASKIIKQISKQFKIKDANIGICGSPLSFRGLQCLPAVKARELMSIYNEHSDVPLPSANHECMNCCGCIRYLEVNSDTEAPLDKAKGKTKDNAEKEPKEPKQPKKKDMSKVYRPGAFSF